MLFIGLFILPILDGQPHVSFGGSSGVISIQNLEKKTLQSVVLNFRMAWSSRWLFHSSRIFELPR